MDGMETVGTGVRLVEELRRREMLSYFPYASIQLLKTADDAKALQDALEKLGIESEDERTDLLHFVDLVRIELLKRRLRQAGSGAIVLGMS